MRRDRVWRHCLKCDQSNDPSSGRVGYGLENVSFHIDGRKYATIWLHMSSATNRFQEIKKLILARISLNSAQ
jgi:hypothetical protein